MSNNKLHKLTRLYGIELFEANETRETYARHSHCEFAIGSILQGVGGYWCRGTHHVLPRHALTLMNPDEPHTGYAVGGGLKYKMLYVCEGAVRSLLGLGPLHGFRDVSPKDPEQTIGRTLERLAALLNQPKSFALESTMQADEMLIALLNTVFQRYAKQEVRCAGREPKAIKTIIERINAYVEDDSAKELTITRLAEEVRLSPNYMIQSFTKARGISPHAFLVNKKICRSKEMIASGMHPLEVGLQLGFYDQSHFIRTFRKVLGITPKDLNVLQ